MAFCCRIPDYIVDFVVKKGETVFYKFLGIIFTVFVLWGCFSNSVSESESVVDLGSDSHARFAFVDDRMQLVEGAKDTVVLGTNKKGWTAEKMMNRLSVLPFLMLSSMQMKKAKMRI